MSKTAIILGATGLTGQYVLQKLIMDERYTAIKLFSRSRTKDLPEKVTQHIGDLLELENFKSKFTADEVYCCIGTTQKKTPDKTFYRKIDYGIPVSAAMLAKDNRINTFLVISAMGANTKSKVFYNKTKGEMEQGVLKQNIKNTFILRPSLIGGERKEKRTIEKIGLLVFKAIQPLLIGKLKKYRIINAETIAQAMINLANTTYKTDGFIASDEIKTIAKTQKK